MKKSTRVWQGVCILVATALVSVLLFLFLYQYDNKYTVPAPQPQNGVLRLDAETMEQYPVLHLIQDFELYRGKLLTPEDFQQNPPLPDELTFIGQYGGFEGARGKTPHGSATYRLNILLPPEQRSYTLELPEIFSSYILYLNGQVAATMGDTNPQNYRAETGNRFVTVQAADRIELLLAVTDYSHFYSGMVYPPAFGTPEAVAKLLDQRYGLRVAVCAIAACVGSLCLLAGIWIRDRRSQDISGTLPFLYAGLCLSLVVYIAHPIIKTLFLGGMSWYAWEIFAYCAMLLLLLCIQQRLLNGRLEMDSFIAFGFFVCLCALCVPWSLQGNLRLMMGYSFLIELYTWISALYLLLGAIWGVYWEKEYSRLLLAGITLFGTALAMDRFLPMFEPIRSGWFSEVGGVVLVFSLGGVMAADAAGQYRLRITMEERVELVSRMLEVQNVYYPLLLEKEEEVRAARHDLRHHLAVLRGFAQEKDIESLIQYLGAYEGAQNMPAATSFCRHYVTDMLLRMYDGMARRDGVSFLVRADPPDPLPISDIELCVILGNLLENALEATSRIAMAERYVSVDICCKLNRLVIFVENRFDGKTETVAGTFLSRKGKNRCGVGLASVRAIAARYGGDADFYAEEDRFYSNVLLPLQSYREG